MRSHGGAQPEPVREVATSFLRLRPLVVTPFVALVLTCLLLSGAPGRQMAGFSIAASCFVAFFFYERRAGALRLVSAPALARSLVVTLAGLTLGATLTGGLASPLVPMLFAPVGVGFAAHGRSRTSTLLLGLLVGAGVALLALTPLVAPLAIAEPWRRVALLGGVVDACVLLYIGISRLASAHARAADALVAAGERIFRASQARTHEMETLAAQVAHEVKNPLAAIRALVEVMLEGASDDARREKRLRIAAGEVARIERLLDGYRAFTHPLATTVRRPVDVAALAHDLVLVLEARAARAGVELSATPTSGLVAEVDPERITEALLNLVSNALDASARAVRIQIARDDRELSLGVVDDGAGMDAETLARAGTPHFTTKREGTGLGISLVRRIAEQHGGRLDLASEPGQGTTATLRLASG